MMAALKAVHDGKLALDQKVTIDAKYQDNDSGTFQHLTPGFWITLRDAMVMMIIFLDQLLWRPVVVWSQKFRVEEGGAEQQQSSWFYDWLRRSA